ncbi:PREDICTED: uncharacterized protein LOC109581914 [Amphimedon queenslandica]|nr:PREDICTED: uncharacterized protein LOC109581914 [Amphimedon queenslandica]|eukprot:XP_019851960.1 PREDICTED: uncharacterized protein LOC109581914 [Amphimedon queenslandica]
MDETPVTMVTLAPPVKDENSSENNINISENVSLCPPGEEEENIRTAPGGATVTNEIGIQTEGEESAAVEPVGVESEEEEESEVDEYAGVKVGPEVDFKRMKSKILKSYLDKANILVASARVMSNTDSKNKDVILRSLRKSLSALGKRGLREFRVGAGIIKQE